VIEPPKKLSKEELRKTVSACAVLIVAAGFEARARRVVDLLAGKHPPRLMLIRYLNGFKENEDNYNRMMASLCGNASRSSVSEIELDPKKPDDYFQVVRRSLWSWKPDVVGEIWIDISALPMQGICATLAAVRECFPGLRVRVLYTEADIYFPTKAEVAAHLGQPLSSISQEMSGNLIPKLFGGSSSEVSTCLILFAGYEKHRSFGVVDELNPSKIVLVHGRPPDQSLAWRLNWSRNLHEALVGTRPTAGETVSTLDPSESLRLLSRYYGFLFGDHNIAVSPICSKMECVGCYLFWERYRDVQIVFPLPVTYLPNRFSEGYRHTFQFLLPGTSDVLALAPSPL
jgi:hypothetical protein